MKHNSVKSFDKHVFSYGMIAIFTSSAIDSTVFINLVLRCLVDNGLLMFLALLPVPWSK